MREKILIETMEWLRDNYSLILNSNKYMNLGIDKIDKALSDYASQKEGPKWVKASEGMPVKSAVFFRMTHERKDERFFVSWEGFKSQLIIGLDKIEWLDESAAAPESGGEQERKFTLQDLIDCYNAGEAAGDFDRKRKQRGLLKSTFFKTHFAVPQSGDIIGYQNTAPPTKESGGDEHFKEITLQNDLEPNKSNSDVTPVASHSSTSSNSIEQENDEPFWQGQEYIQGGELPKAEQLFEDNGLRLELTCGACPEQYDVFKQVGYLRLRHGEFRVDFPDCGGVTIYEAEPKGDGIFEGGERMKYLTEAMNAILKKLKTDDHC